MRLKKKSGKLQVIFLLASYFGGYEIYHGLHHGSVGSLLYFLSFALDILKASYIMNEFNAPSGKKLTFVLFDHCTFDFPLVC